MNIHKLMVTNKWYGGLWPPTSRSSRGDLGALWAPQIQYSTLQYNIIQYSTVQYSTVQYSTVQYSTVQYSTVQYSTVQYSTVQYSTVQYSIYLYIYTMLKFGINWSMKCAPIKIKYATQWHGNLDLQPGDNVKNVIEEEGREGGPAWVLGRPNHNVCF